MVGGVSTVSVLRTKPIKDVVAQGNADGSDGSPGLKRRLGARHLIGFGIGVVIGTGIFTLTGIEAQDTAGPAVVISFAIAGVVALLAALCYAELASSVPTAGSAYSYAYATIGELSPGSSAGTCSWSSRSAPPWSPAAGRATWATCSACRRRCSARRRRSTSAPR